MDAVRWITCDGEILAGIPEGRELMLKPGKLRLIDQTKLPVSLCYIQTDNIAEVHDAISRLVIRGAPAIGCAAALGLSAAAAKLESGDNKTFICEIRKMAAYLASSRPTAVNLEWALKRCVRRIEGEEEIAADAEALKESLLEEALGILEEDIRMCRQIGANGLPLLKDGYTVLTHCNAGALATADYGTALSPIYAAKEAGMKIRVFSDETRPLLQGSRLTAWELHQAGIEVITICDNMAGQVMKEGKIDIVIVGADRISANGDTANKIGTYSLAILARHHSVPFYVAAPYSTIDMSLENGDMIPIEQRSPDEIRCAFGKPTAPEDIAFYNPAFDVTPNTLISGIITERGIVPPPFDINLKLLFSSHAGQTCC